jgi:hypothetical protein
MSDPVSVSGPDIETLLADPAVVRLAAEAMEDTAIMRLGRDLGTVYRDEIASATLAAVAGVLRAHIATWILDQVAVMPVTAPNVRAALAALAGQIANEGEGT